MPTVPATRLSASRLDDGSGSGMEAMDCRCSLQESADRRAALSCAYVFSSARCGEDGARSRRNRVEPRLSASLPEGDDVRAPALPDRLIVEMIGTFGFFFIGFSGVAAAITQPGSVGSAGIAASFGL